MRTVTDALRSMGRYVSEILQPQPVLAEFTWTDTVPNPHVVHRWTTNGMVAGDVEVDFNAFGFLKQQDRRTPTLLTNSLQQPYLSSALVADPRPAALAAGYDLTTGPVVVGWELPVMPAYEVRFAGERGDFQPPFARVELVTAGGTSGPALYYERTQPMSIECYPVQAVDAESAVFNATAVLDALEHGFRGAGVTEGKPLRVPLWDYDTVGLDEAATFRLPNDFMRVQDLSLRTLVDPTEPRRVAAIADIRVSWRNDLDLSDLTDRDGSPVQGTRVVASVNESFDTSQS